MSLFSGSIEDFRCPICLGRLSNDLSSELLVCDEGHEFLVKDDIPIFSKDPDFYYGEIPEGEMEQLLAELDQPGDFEDKFARFLKTKSDQFQDSLLRYIFDPRRSAFSFQLPIDKDSKVLDVGCGWGSLSIQLHNKAAQIHGMDLTQARLRFFKNWLSAKDINNISIVCGGDTQFLPYKDNFFDLVLMNGILEWTPLSFEGDPEEVQIKYLQEVRRILKDDGYLYLAIENRYGYQYFLGKPDDHSNLLFGSLLPRKIANLYSALVRDKPYRTYTYSYDKYRQLLNRAGFPSETAYSVLPNYRYPQTYFPADSPSSLNDLQGSRLAGSIQDRAKSIIRKSVKFPRFAPAYSFIAGANKYQGLVLEILYEDFPEYIWVIKRIIVTTTQVVVFSCVGERVGEPPKELLIRLPLCDYAEAQCSKNYVMMESIHKKGFPFAAKVPRPVKESALSGQRYFIEEFVKGFSGSMISRLDQSDLNEHLLCAYNFIVEMGKETRQSANDGEGLGVLRERFSEIVQFPWEEPSRQLISDAFEKLIAEYQRDNIFSVMSHNDFHLGNLIFESGGDRLLAVIDWNFAQNRDVPGLDIIHLMAHTVKQGFKESLPTSIERIVFNAGIGFPDLISKYNDDLGICLSREIQVLAYLLLMIERNIRAIRGLGVGSLYYSRVHKENAQLVQLVSKLMVI